MLDKLINRWKALRNRFVWESNEGEHKDTWRMGVTKDQKRRRQRTYSIHAS